MKIKILISAISILLISIYANTAFAFNSKKNMMSEQDYSFMQQYKVASPLNLVISTTGGNISAVGQEGNTVEVSFIVALKGKVLKMNFDQLKDYAEVEIINDNSKLEINVKKILDKKVSIGFSIKIPINTSVNFNTSGGNIALNALTGKQAIYTSGGNIDLDKLTGNVTAKTSGGNISISNSKADFDANTSGGNISLEKIDGKLDVSTSGGNINAENITNSLVAKTSGGNINLSKIKGLIDVKTSGGEILLNDISGTASAKTSGGDIKANILSLTGKLELRTSGGTINVTLPSAAGLDLDLSADNVNLPPSDFVGSSTKERVIGKLNGGGITVLLATSGGNIVLNYK